MPRPAAQQSACLALSGRAKPGLEFGPVGEPAPLVFDSPHTGVLFPDDFKPAIPLDTRERVADWFVEELFGIDPLTTRSAASDPMLDCFDLEAMAADMAIAPVPLPPLSGDPSEIYSAECVTDGNDFRLSDGAGAIGQPELEAWLREHAAGTPYDRIDQTEQIMASLAERAVRQGLFRR